MSHARRLVVGCHGIVRSLAALPRATCLVVGLIVLTVVVSSATACGGHRSGHHSGLRRLSRTHVRDRSPGGEVGRVRHDGGRETAPGASGDGVPTPDPDGSLPPAAPVVDRDVVVDVDLDDGIGHGVEHGVVAHLGGRLTRQDGSEGPAVVIVPGAGDVSRDGLRKGDGVSAYAAPVDVTRRWARAFAARGAIVLAYDKRTCGQNDDPQCTTNPQTDVDAKGPVALARDVDAACALVRREPGFDGRLVLFAHGQAAQVALSSSCAAEANALVLVSPIPRAIDLVLVDALDDRRTLAEAAARAATSPDEKAKRQAEAATLKNQAASRAASFASMASGKFAADARVDGATIAFWTGWRALTAATPSLLEPVRGRVVVVAPADDRQLSRGDRAAVKALPAQAIVVVDGADHHALIGGELAPAVIEPVLEAVDALLLPGGA